MMRSTIAAAVVLSCAAIAHADPALPAAQRTEIETHGKVDRVVYVPAAAGAWPERWIAFVGDASAPDLSAWIATPSVGAANAVQEVRDWPRAVRVVEAVHLPLPAAIPDFGGNRLYVFVVAESLAAPAIGQRAGDRTILPIRLDEPGLGTGILTSKTSLPAFAGVTGAPDVAPRLAAAAALWTEAPKPAIDDEHARDLLAKAAHHDAALAKLIPSGGIAVWNTWQGVFAERAGTVTRLDRSAATAALRAALASVMLCASHECGSLAIGAEHGRLVIRGVFVESPAHATRAPRRAVAATGSGAQTRATARLLEVGGQLRGEAPLLANGTATIGVLDDTVVIRDGAYAAALSANQQGSSSFAFGDFDGDGLTDTVLFGVGPTFVLTPRTWGGDDTAYLELAAIGTTSAAAAAAAALALPEDALTPKQACAVLVKARTPRGVAAILAPGGEIFGYTEPGEPARGLRETFSPDRAASELKHACDVTACDARRPVCASDINGPAESFYQFVRAGTTWKLVHAAIYAGG